MGHGLQQRHIGSIHGGQTTIGVGALLDRNAVQGLDGPQGTDQPGQHVHGMGSERSDHTAALIRLGIPVPAALGIGTAAHQPVELHQPGRADGTGLQKACGLHEQGHSAVFVVHSHRQPPCQGQPLQLAGLIGMQRDGLLQQQVLARLQGPAGQVEAGCRWGGDDHRVHRGISQQGIPVAESLQAMGSRGGIQALLARVPKRHRLKIRRCCKGRQVHLLPEAETGDGNTKGLWGHLSWRGVRCRQPQSRR